MKKTRRPHLAMLMIASAFGLLQACGEDPTDQQGDTAGSFLSDQVSNPDDCAALRCNNHGTCDFSARLCVCDEPYAGRRCNKCASGYELDGSDCVPTSDPDPDPDPCEPLSCESGDCGAKDDGCGSTLDCGICAESCGDGVCDVDESCTSCSADCGACTPGPLSEIPEVPFDYLQAPGPTTSSGDLPATITAGEVLEFSTQTVVTDHTLHCEGTEQDPAFIVGGALQGNSDVFYITGSWCFFIDTVFTAMQPRPNGDHIVFRNVEITGSTAKNGMNLNGSDVVVYGSEIHHNQRNGNDAHGIQVGQGATNMWVLGNHIHHNSGNGLQACHGCSENPPSGIFIGDNLFHSDREVGIGLKYADNVIIEGNVFHSYVAAQANTEWCFDDGSSCGTWNSGSDGTGVVVGADGAPTRVVIVANEIYGTSNAVRIEESNEVQVVDNNFHDITNRCLALDKEGENTVFRGNTCRNADRGIFQNWRDNFSLTVDDNTFQDLTGPAIEYESRNVCDASTLTQNTFSATGPVICGNTESVTTEEVNALPGAANNVVE